MPRLCPPLELTTTGVLLPPIPVSLSGPALLPQTHLQTPFLFFDPPRHPPSLGRARSFFCAHLPAADYSRIRWQVPMPRWLSSAYQ